MKLPRTNPKWLRRRGRTTRSDREGIARSNKVGSKARAGR